MFACKYVDDYLGFEWDLLPADSLVVDVGGGLGTVTVGLAERYAHLQLVIQDLPAVVAQTRKVSPLQLMVPIR